MTIKIRQYLAGINDKRTSNALRAIYDINNPVPSAVTQITNRSTGVTVTTLSGTITTINTSLAAEAAASFVVTCPGVAIGDVVVVAQQSGAVGVNTVVTVIAVAAGSFTLAVMNGNAAAGVAETGAILINYAVIKARV
jgi:hypothetical protein